MKKISKTNVCRILDKEKIKYKHIVREEQESFEDVNEDSNIVFKTLVLVGSDKNHYVCVIPLNEHLDLKKAAKNFNIKSIQMLMQKDLKNLTGYVHGGCSPIGMKKLFKTFIDISAKGKEYIFVSGGKVGLQVKINPDDILKVTNGKYEDIVK